MVVPEGKRAPDRRPRPGNGSVIVIVFIAAVVGGGLLWGLTTPAEPVAAPTSIFGTTPTTELVETPVDEAGFSVDQIATGQPLDWTLVAGGRGHFPMAILLHDNVLYAFTARSTQRFDTPRGVNVWKSWDGVEWIDLGLVLPQDIDFGSVVSSPQGILALATSESGSVLWRSDDGASWDTIEIPDSAPGLAISSMVASANDEVIVVAVNEFSDPTDLIDDRFLDHFGLPALPEDMWIDWSVGLEDIRFRLIGPFDIGLGEATSVELGLTDAEEDLIWAAASRNNHVRILSAAGGLESWRQAEIDFDWIDSFVNLTDGSIAATAFGEIGPETIVSHDGLNWSRGDLETDWLVLRGSRHEPDISSLYELLHPELTWWPSTVAHGAGGTAAVMLGDAYSEAQQGNPQPLTIERNDVIFRFDPWGSQILGTDGAKTYRWGPFSSNVTTDLSDGVIRFLGDDDDEALGSFSIEELAAYQDDVWSRASVDPIQRHVAIAVSRDGENWTIQPGINGMGDRPGSMTLAISGDRIYAIVPKAGTFFSVNIGFEIWSAPIPQG